MECYAAFGRQVDKGMGLVLDEEGVESQGYVVSELFVSKAFIILVDVSVSFPETIWL